MLRFMLCAAVAVLVSSSGALQVYAQKIPDPTTGNSKFDAAVVAGVQFLKTDILKSKDGPHGGPLSLEAYAIMKAGVSHSDPAVHKAVEEVRKKVQGSIYTPESQQEHVYEAGVDAMLLSDHDPDANRKELQAIAGYLMAQQGADGSWDYPQRRVGDTSMNQYGVLGLWACMRAGVKVPPTVWDRCLRWHIKGQSNDGGWAYHPGRQEGPGQGSSTHNMTFGATGTMAICRLLIYPEHAPGGKNKKKVKKKLFGVLEEKVVDQNEETKNPYDDYKPEVSISAVENSINSGLNWINARWRTSLPGSETYRMYFYYAMERSLAMNDIKRVGGQDWFTVCGNVLLSEQRADGSWTGGAGPGPGTALAVLFYMRSTQKILGKEYGKGLQVGDRGFDLTQGDPLADDKKKKRKLGPLDEMLARLEQQNLQGIKDVQDEDLSAVVEKILQTPRKQLIGQVQLLKKLADHPNGRVRQVVMFALGRSGDMRVAPILIDALNDNDVAVLNEAHTALCYISRKPRAFGLETDLASEVSGLPQEEVDRIVSEWRRKAQLRWRRWYARIRPYDERGDLWEMQGKSAGSGDGG